MCVFYPALQPCPYFPFQQGEQLSSKIASKSRTWERALREPLSHSHPQLSGSICWPELLTLYQSFVHVSWGRGGFLMLSINILQPVRIYFSYAFVALGNISKTATSYVPEGKQVTSHYYSQKPKFKGVSRYPSWYPAWGGAWGRNLTPFLIFLPLSQINLLPSGSVTYATTSQWKWYGPHGNFENLWGYFPQNILFQKLSNLWKSCKNRSNYNYPNSKEV